MTAKEFLDSLTSAERERFWGCIVKLFNDDATSFAKAVGISIRQPEKAIARKSFL